MENNWLWGCLSNKLRSEEVHLEQLVVVLPIREEEVHVGKHKSFSGICFNIAAFCNITSLAKGPLVYWYIFRFAMSWRLGFFFGFGCFINYGIVFCLINIPISQLFKHIDGFFPDLIYFSNIAFVVTQLFSVPLPTSPHP